jgi:hypothetical protein
MGIFSIQLSLATRPAHLRSQVQQLQQKIEEANQELSLKYDQQAKKFRKRIFDLRFDEPDIERHFSDKTYGLQQRYMTYFIILLMLYLIISSLALNVPCWALPACYTPLHHCRPCAAPQLLPRGYAPIADTWLLSTPSPPATCAQVYQMSQGTQDPFTVNMTDEDGDVDLIFFSAESQFQRLSSALIYRCNATLALGALIAFLAKAPRRIALGAIVAVHATSLHTSATPKHPLSLCPRATAIACVTARSRLRTARRVCLPTALLADHFLHRHGDRL